MKTLGMKSKIKNLKKWEVWLSYVVIIAFLLGIASVWTNQNLAYLFLSLPAGWGAGDALATIKQRWGEKE